MDDATTSRLLLLFCRLDTACLEHCEAVLATRVSATPADLPWYDLPPDATSTELHRRPDSLPMIASIALEHPSRHGTEDD